MFVNAMRMRIDAAAFQVRAYGARHFAVYAPDGALVVVAVYRRGATEVAFRLNAAADASNRPEADGARVSNGFPLATAMPSSEGLSS